MTDDVRKLLGGYATGTLSEEEKQLLFDAALKDDDLFAALADEQALKEILDDSSVRAQLLRAAEEPRFSVMTALRDWFDRPKAKALIATGAVLLTVIGVQTARQPSPAPVSVARNEKPAAPPAVQPEPAPPQAAELKPEPSKPEAKSKPAPSKAADKFVKKEEADRPSANAVIVAQAPPTPAQAAPAAEVASLRDEARITAPLRYDILRKEANGEFQAVPHDYEFTANDVIRVRVTSTRAGMVAVSGPGVSLVTGAAAPNIPILLPPEAGMVVPAATDKLVLSLTPGVGVDERPAQGFIGGAVSRAKRAAADAPTLTLDIPIRHRK